MRAVAHREHQHRGRAVHREPGRDLRAARLQEGLLVGFAVAPARGRLRAAQHREDRADRDVHVDVGRAIQRVEEQQVLALREVRRDRVRVLHLLGGERGEVAAPFVGLEQDLVREHVELLLHLALHVVRARRAEVARKGALVDCVADRLAGARHGLDQEAQVGVDERLVALALDEKAREADAACCHYWCSPVSAACGRGR